MGDLAYPRVLNHRRLLVGVARPVVQLSRA
jgi:hypothetical protein